MDKAHRFVQPISFGDCDPAGIVFYPNVFRWIDAAFHDCLRRFGGHEAICNRLGAVGLGLIEVAAKFRSPMRDGDRLELEVSIDEWGRRTLTLTYEGLVKGRPVLAAKEVRGLFKATSDGILAADLSEVRRILEGRADG